MYTILPESGKDKGIRQQFPDTSLTTIRGWVNLVTFGKTEQFVKWRCGEVEMVRCYLIMMRWLVVRQDDAVRGECRNLIRRLGGRWAEKMHCHFKTFLE